MKKPWQEKCAICITVLIFGLLLLQTFENITLTHSSSHTDNPTAQKTVAEWEKTFATAGLTLHPAQFWKPLE